MARKVCVLLYVVVIVAASQAVMRLYDSHGLLEAVGAFVVAVLVAGVLTRLIARTYASDAEAS